MAPSHLFPGFLLPTIPFAIFSQKEEKTLMRHFLTILFEKTKSVLETELEWG